ncbi:MAG: protein tyrosine phosphatase [Rhodobacterales bacterium]|nr:MAG: protein tyrosine phosphatase [Rhodobacterales bacterium]
MGLLANLKSRERALKKSLNVVDFSVPGNRRRAQIYTLFFDHAVLRLLWSNFMNIAPGVYRSNHPSHRRLEKLSAMGIKTILTLRGGARLSAPYHLEKESCEALGLPLVTAALNAREAPRREVLLELIDTFRTIQVPFLMHCKSGADRASLASAIYLMVIQGTPVAEARKMLSPRFLHFKWTRTGILDHVLDLYEQAQRATGIGFEDWVATEYDADAAQAGFDEMRATR